MNRKSLVILLVLVLTVGGIGVATFFQNRAAWNVASDLIGQKPLEKMVVNDVAQIHIKQAKSELTLARQESGWGIKERGGFPADLALIGEFLLKMRDAKVLQSEAIPADKRFRLDLAEPGADKGAGTLLELRGKDGKPLQSLILGRQHRGKPPIPVPGQEGPPDGRYLLLTPAATSFVLVSEPLNQVDTKPEKWFGKDFIRIDHVKTLAVTPFNAKEAWKMARATEDGQWEFVGGKPGEKLDPSKAVSVVNPLYGPSFSDVVADAKPEAVGFDKPVQIVIETFDGFTYQMKIGIKPGDANNMYFGYSVDAKLVKEPRQARKDEKAEDKDKLDKEHDKKFQETELRYVKEKALSRWVYVVETKTFVPLTRERSAMVEKPEPVEKKGAKK